MTRCQNDTSVKKGSTQNDTLRCQNGDDSLKKKEKKEKKSTTPLPPKDVEGIKAGLEKVDLPRLREKYSTKDVNGTWEEFYEACLEGTSKTEELNPYNYVNFTKGFITWLKKRPDIKTTKAYSREERAAELVAMLEKME